MVNLLKNKKGDTPVFWVILKWIFIVGAVAVVILILITAINHFIPKITGTEQACDCLSGENCNEETCNRLCATREWVNDNCVLIRGG